MGEGLVKYLSGKVVGAILGVCGIIVVIWYWRLEPGDRATIWQTARAAILWAGCVAALPWALFFVPPRVAALSNNTASGLMLLSYLVLDAGMALYLMGGWPAQTWQRGALVFGLLCAAIYNFIVCEFLADRLERVS
ncbi:MAG: hypothetical protein AMXMBFR13_45090 [Phycisphaerae bacterium]|jgi:hypothetical protein